MLRILHISPYSPDAWAYGGIPRLAGTLSREMSRQGHQVTFCSTDAHDASSRIYIEASNSVYIGQGIDAGRRGRGTQNSDGVDWQLFPNVSNRLAYHCQFFTPIGLNTYLRRHAGDFDIAHLHACRNLPGAMAAHHLLKAGVPYVVAPNGTASRVERFFLAKRAFDLAAGNRVMRNAARVLAVSHVEQKQLRTLGVPEAAICTIPNPVDLEEFTPAIERGRFRARTGIGDAPIVLFLGKLTPRKNVDVLIRAFDSMAKPQARLVIAGNDMGAGRRARALVDELDLSDRTIFTGLLEGRERLEAMADADVLVYPSEHEIFGLVPLEALLCGTPVVVGGDSGCGEVITAIGGGQVVEVGNAVALAGAIRQILDDPTPWREKAHAAAVRVRSDYGGAVISARVVAMYRRLLRERGASKWVA